MFADVNLCEIQALWQRCLTIIVGFLLLISLGALFVGCGKKMSGKMLQAWKKASFLGKIILPLCVIADIFAGGGKSPDARSACGDEPLRPLVQQVDVVRGYNAPVEGVPDEDVFVRPEGAFTPSRWQGLGVSDDWQLMPGDLSASVCGIVTTPGYGLSDWNRMSPDVSVYAPFIGEHALLPGISDFWCVTNALYKRFVWKDVADGRNPDQLISFAAQVSECGDVIYVYNDAALASTNITSFLQIDGERMPVAPTQTNSCAVLIERDIQQTPEWWIRQYPGLCELNAEGEIVWTYDDSEYYRIDVDLRGDDDCSAARSRSDVTIKLAKENARLYVHCFNRDQGKATEHFNVSDRKQIVDLVLETGMRYEVFARYTINVDGQDRDYDCPITSISTPSGVNAVRVNAYKWLVWRPVNLLISPVNQPAGKYNRFHASLSPAISKGSYTWSASGPFRVATPTAQTTEVFRNGPGAGTLTCVWRRGLLAVTNSIALAETDMTQGGDYFGLSLDTPVILKEDAHLDVNGNAVPASSPSSRLDLTYSGSTAGEIEISSNNANVRLRDGFVLRELPIRINVSEPVHHQWEVDLSQVPENVHEVEFASRFTPSEGDVSFDCQTTLRMVKLMLEADAPWPGNRSRHVFGPCETVTARIEPTTFSTIWHDGARQTNGSQFDISAPNAAMGKSIDIEIEGTSISVPLRYIAPSGCAADSARAMTSADWTALNMPEPEIGKVGVGLYTNVRLLPDYVSFTNVWIREGYSPALGREGYFTHILVSPHNDANGAGVALQITSENGFIDRAGHSNNSVTITPAPGSFRFEIPMSWSVDNVSYAQFCVNVQAYESFASGALRVSKFGCSCQRELDGGTTVTQPGGQ